MALTVPWMWTASAPVGAASIPATLAAVAGCSSFDSGGDLRRHRCQDHGRREHGRQGHRRQEHRRQDHRRQDHRRQDHRRQDHRRKMAGQRPPVGAPIRETRAVALPLAPAVTRVPRHPGDAVRPGPEAVPWP